MTTLNEELEWEMNYKFFDDYVDSSCWHMGNHKLEDDNSFWRCEDDRRLWYHVQKGRCVMDDFGNLVRV